MASPHPDPYTYASNDPTDRVDPSGRSDIAPGGGGGEGGIPIIPEEYMPLEEVEAQTVKNNDPGLDTSNMTKAEIEAQAESDYEASTGGETAAAGTACAQAGSEPQTDTTTEAAEAAGGSLRAVEGVLNGLPKGKQSFVRVVPDAASLDSTFDELTKGGTPTTWKNFSGTVIERGDGVEVGLRNFSKSGGPAIDIRMPDGRFYRIHVGE